MRNEWILTPIGAQVTLQRGFDITREQQSPGTVPVVSSGGVSSYHNVAMARAPGVVLGRKGTLGSVYFFAEDYWPHDTTLWVKDFHGNHPRFVFYFFKNMSELLHSMDVGAANPSLNRNHIHPIEVNWPPRPEQKAIATILGSLDDKIELNRRMNETLEGMARTIFKSWFVNFDPVWAKKRGQKPVGMDSATAALFPNDFEDSKLGKIPKGWKVGKIGDLVRVVGGGTPSTNEPSYWDPPIHYWATPKDMSRLHSPVILETERKISDLGIRQISSGLLPRGTVLLSSRAPIGYLAISEVPIGVNQGFIAMVCDDALPNYFILHWAKQNMELIESRANGTTFLEISKTNFRPMEVIVPSPKVTIAFVRIVEPLHQRIVATLKESRTLAVLRDTLLSKLMSGEIRVKEAEKFVEETT